MSATFKWACANCGREPGNLEEAFEFKDNIVCAECYQRLRAAMAMTKTDSDASETAIASKTTHTVKRIPRADPEHVGDETTLFQGDGISVTTARFTVGAQTFAMRNITSVQANRVPAHYVVCVLYFVLGGGALLAGFSASGPAAVAILLSGLVFLAAGMSSYDKQKTTFSIVLKTSDGEVAAYQSEDESHIAWVTAALNDAIASQD